MNNNRFSKLLLGTALLLAGIGGVYEETASAQGASYEVGGPRIRKRASAPANPSSAYIRLWVDNTGALFTLDSAGVSTPVGGGAGTVSSGAANAIPFYDGAGTTLNDTVLFIGGDSTNPRLGFGGATSSFPAIRRTTTLLQAVLADNSALTDIQVDDLVLSDDDADAAVTLASHATVTASYTLTFPAAAPAANTTPLLVSTAGAISYPTGTPDGTKFLRDDGSWQTVSAGVGGSGTAGVVPYFSAGTTLADSPLLRADANTMEQRNSTNAQELRVYNAYTGATNYEFGKLEWASNVWRIATEKGSGGGTARSLALATDDVDRLVIDASGGITMQANTMLKPANDLNSEIGTYIRRYKYAYLGYVLAYNAFAGQASRPLTDNTIQTFVRIALGDTNGVVGGTITYTIEAVDSTNNLSQATVGVLPFILVKEGGALTVTLGSKVGETFDPAGGTLTTSEVTFASSVSGSNGDIRVTFNYDQAVLTGTVAAAIRYQVAINGDPNIVGWTVTPQ